MARLLSAGRRPGGAQLAVQLRCQAESVRGGRCELNEQRLEIIPAAAR